MQHEITAKGPLLDSAGRLAQKGYAKGLILDYQRSAIKAAAHRIKEWDYYLVMGPSYAVALTVADNSYMGLMSASLLDFKTGWQQTTSEMTFMPRGRTGLPQSSSAGVSEFHNKRVDFRFSAEGGRRTLFCRFAKFKGDSEFSCDIVLDDRQDDSMVIATPFEKDDKAFYYNQKINCMPAAGKASFGGREYIFEPENSFGTLDWGRGVWTYSNTWYWGSASGSVGGKRFGFNIGYGFGDTSAASENMLFYDGKAHKLEGVSFNIPKDASGRDDFMSPWTFSSSDGRFTMDFVPVMDRVAVTSVLVIESNQHQVFGKFTGVARLDNGTEIKIKDFMGFAEKVKNRW